MGRLSTPTAAVGVVALLVAGGGAFALASSSGGTISVCVKHKDGTLYKARKCAKHDKKLTWNKAGPQGNTGPQGPGATYFVYNATGRASPTSTAIGTIGPFKFTGECQASAGTTTERIRITGPGEQLDEFTSQGAISEALPPSRKAIWDSDASNSTTPVTFAGDSLMIPTSGAATEHLETFSVTGGATNTCHFSAAITPTSAERSSSARRLVPQRPQTALSSGRPGGVTMFGVPVR